LKANISNETKERVSEILERPVERNLDKAINECLDSLENGNAIEMKICDTTKQEIQNA